MLFWFELSIDSQSSSCPVSPNSSCGSPRSSHFPEHVSSPPQHYDNAPHHHTSNSEYHSYHQGFPHPAFQRSHVHFNDNSFGQAENQRGRNQANRLESPNNGNSIVSPSTPYHQPSSFSHPAFNGIPQSPFSQNGVLSGNSYPRASPIYPPHPSSPPTSSCNLQNYSTSPHPCGISQQHSNQHSPIMNCPEQLPNSLESGIPRILPYSEHPQYPESYPMSQHQQIMVRHCIQ